MAPTPRSWCGSTTTPATPSRSPSMTTSPAPSCWTHSPKQPEITGFQPQCSPTTASSTPLGSPATEADATTSKLPSPTSTSTRNTPARTTPGPAAKSNDSIRPSRNGSLLNHQPPPRRAPNAPRPVRRPLQPAAPPPLTRAQDSLPELKLHCLRHTWATLALAEGVDIHIVSEHLNHSSTHVTRLYRAMPPSAWLREFSVDPRTDCSVLHRPVQRIHAVHVLVAELQRCR